MSRSAPLVHALPRTTRRFREAFLPRARAGDGTGSGNGAVPPPPPPPPLPLSPDDDLPDAFATAATRLYRTIAAAPVRADAYFLASAGRQAAWCGIAFGLGFWVR